MSHSFSGCCGCCSVAQSCLTLCDPRDYSIPGFPVPHCLPEFAQTRVHWVGDAIQLAHPLLLPSLPSLSLSRHQSLFQWVGSSHQMAKVLELSFSISPPNKPSGFISFWIDWTNFLAVQRTLKCLLQYHSLKASTFWRLASFMVRLLHPYTTTRKTMALTIWTFVSTVMPAF